MNRNVTITLGDLIPADLGEPLVLTPTPARALSDWDWARAIGTTLGAAPYRTAFTHWLRMLRRKDEPSSDDARYLRTWRRRSSLSTPDFIRLFNLLMDDGALGVTTCHHCAELIFPEREHIVNDGTEVVCASCFQYYFECDSCQTMVHRNAGVTVHEYGRVCRSCIDDDRLGASACDRCGEWYMRDNLIWDDNAEVYYCHEHAPASQCEPQYVTFEFPALNSPQKSITNDEILAITVGQGEVSSQGMMEIRQYIQRKTAHKTTRAHGIDVPELTDGDQFDNVWQNKEGNVTKRIAKHLLVERSFKLSEEVMSEIGNLAKQHAGAPGTHYISITRDLNQSAEMFVHDGSCWWGSESHSRCELKAWYGFGVRTWSTPDQYGHPVSRAWLMPLNVSESGIAGAKPRFTDTHVLPADAYVLFNAYGAIEQMPYARIIASMVGKSYRRVCFEAGDMYINANGILIAEQSICDATDRVRLDARRGCHCRGN